MKKIIFLAALMGSVGLVSAQNSNPWPTTGNVGIGTATPSNKLVVLQNNLLVPAVLVQDSGTGDAALAFNVSGASFTWGIDQSDGKKFKLSNSTTLGVSDFITVTNTTGNVGIGTTTPSSPLSIVGASGVSTVSIQSTASLATDNAGITFGAGRTTVGYDGTYGGLKLAISDNSKPIIFGNSITAGAGEFARFTGSGNLGIGVANPTDKLAVNGTIHAKEVRVDLTGWPDYVFKKEYKLPTLSEVKDYIDKNQHLPDMPSEKEVADNGLNLGEMNKLLTKKVEELTLYLIEQNKTILELQNSIKKIKNKN